MNDSIEISTVLTTLALGVPRMLAVFLILPFMGENVLSGPLKGYVAFGLTLVAMPLVFFQLPEGGVDNTQLLLLLPKEMFIGLTFGFVTGLPFWAAAQLGKLLDLQRGAMAASMFTPVLPDQTTPLGNVFSQAAIVLVFVTGGFLFILKGIYISYEIWPVTSFAPVITPMGAERMAALFGQLMFWTLVLAAPFIIVIFTVDLVMGLLNRFIPEINVFFLAMPFKGLAVMSVLVVYMGTMTDFLQTQYISGEAWFNLIRDVMR
ncbi:MAG: type III secretion system export apparatus subunit SctT [Aquisalimonadaceae bacterium]